MRFVFSPVDVPVCAAEHPGLGLLLDSSVAVANSSDGSSTFFPMFPWRNGNDYSENGPIKSAVRSSLLDWFGYCPLTLSIPASNPKC